VALGLVLSALTSCAPAPTATPVPPTKAPAKPTAKPVEKRVVEVPDIYMWPDDYDLEWVDTSQYKKDPPYKFGFSNCSTSNAWAVLFWETAKWEAEKHPEIAEFYTTDAGDNGAKQLSDIEDLIAKGIDVLIVRPCTLDAGVPGIEKAMDAGIPVIISNRSTGSDKYVSQQTTSMVAMGRNQGQWLVDQLGGKGKILSFEGPAGSGPQVERYKGAMEILAKYPEIEILARKTTNWSRAEAKTAMEDYLQAFDQIDGILDQSGIMAAGVAEAIEEAGIDPKTIPQTGDDYNGWMKWIQENESGMITTNPNWCSGASIIAALMTLNGQQVPKQWFLRTTIYDASNIDEVVVPERSDEWFTSILPDDWEISGR
jgi:ABC-type sugar transport system substrate-binding protein